MSVSMVGMLVPDVLFRLVVEKGLVVEKDGETQLREPVVVGCGVLHALACLDHVPSCGLPHLDVFGAVGEYATEDLSCLVALDAARCDEEQIRVSPQRAGEVGEGLDSSL